MSVEQRGGGGRFRLIGRGKKYFAFLIYPELRQRLMKPPFVCCSSL
jgi:hypothetical protein